MADSTKTSSLYQALWSSADELRSKMDASEYKNYLLGLIFYKYLSDKMLYTVVKILQDADMLDEGEYDLKRAQEIYVESYLDEDVKEDLLDNLQSELGYTIKPELTYTNLMKEIYDSSFELENLQQGFKDIEQSNEAFSNLFSDVDLYSNKLGRSIQKQNEVISSVMKHLAPLDVAGHDGDVLGDAYEYLIGQFASDSGKNAGEFYTPQSVSTLMTRIAIYGREDKAGFTVYDPTMGSGSLMLNVKKYSHEPQTIGYFGQELNTSTYNLARMNMILHGVPIENQHLNNGDSLDEDWPTDEPTNFDATLMNPPYSAKWSAKEGFKTDPRFSQYNALAPKSKADFAFLLHGFYHLKEDGVMAIVLPHGVLFRGAAEGKIRKVLLENGSIDTVIGLPANIFFNTSIPTTVIILKKNRSTKDVLFIDASKEFVKQKAQNKLTSENIKKIFETYVNREDVEKFAHVASFDEIQENDFNLNIPRYVDTFEEEEPIPLDDVAKDIVRVNKEIQEAENNLFEMMKQLHGTTPEAQKELDEFMSLMEQGGVFNG